MRLLLVLALAACGTAAPPHHDRPTWWRPTFPSAAGGPVEVTGAVNRPGVIPYYRGITLGYAIAAAGGLSDRRFGGKTMIEVQRTELGHQRQFQLLLDRRREQGVELAPGDLITVSNLSPLE